MALRYTHQNRNVFALLSEREVPVIGGGVEVVEPAPVEVQGGEEPIARSSKAVAEILVQATAARALPIVGGGVTVDAPAPVTVDGGAEATARASQASATTLLAAENSRTLTVIGGGVAVINADPVSVAGGEEAIGRSSESTTDVTQPVTAEASRTLSVVGGGVTISKGSPVDVQGGEEAVSRSTQSGSQVTLNQTFFPNSSIAANSSGCSSNGFLCDSDSATDLDTASASPFAGKQVTISFDVVTCSANANGDVTVRFIDGSGSQLASKTKTFTAAEDGQTVTFNASAPSGTEQIEIRRNVSAQSVNDFGSTGCDGTCSTEGVLIDQDVILTA